MGPGRMLNVPDEQVAYLPTPEAIQGRLRGDPGWLGSARGTAAPAVEHSAAGGTGGNWRGGGKRRFNS